MQCRVECWAQSGTARVFSRVLYVACCLLRVVCCVLSVACCLLRAACRLLQCCMWCVACCLLRAVCCMSSVAMLCAACRLLQCCVLSFACRLLHAVGCVLSIACCALRAVCCMCAQWATARTALAQRAIATESLVLPGFCTCRSTGKAQRSTQCCAVLCCAPASPGYTAGRIGFSSMRLAGASATEECLA